MLAEAPRHDPPPPQVVTLRLVLCHKCRRPVGRLYLTPGSVVEFKCRSCGSKHTEVGG